MDTFLNIFHLVGRGLHWLTGWLVHPNKGGCCVNNNPADLFTIENFVKEDEKK